MSRETAWRPARVATTMLIDDYPGIRESLINDVVRHSAGLPVGLLGNTVTWLALVRRNGRHS